MDVDHSFQLRQTADTLEQLADLVEHCGMSAADVGDIIWNTYKHSHLELSADARHDLMQLRRSGSDTTQFAAGLRRQAMQLRNRTTQAVPHV